jgi:peptide/nickel transport system substrate-binding protein
MTSSHRIRPRPRRLTRRRLLGVLGGAGLSAAGLACSPAQTTPTPVPAGARGGATATPTGTAAAPLATATTVVRAPKRGGHFRWGSTSAWPHLDPRQTTNSSVFGFGIGVCYSRLLKFKLRDVPQPAFVPTGDAAVSWDQPDETTYVVKLRPNAKWQNIPPVNGRPLVVEDVRYSYDRQRTKGFANASFLEAIAKLEVIDPSTLRIVTAAPAADFLVNIAAPQSVIVAREAVELAGDLKAGPLIGSGPFIVSKEDPNGTSLAVRNPDFYFAGLPYVDAYELTIAADNEPLKAAFRSGNLEIMPGLTQDDVDVIRRTKPDVNLQMVRGLGSGTEFGLKLDRPPFNDVRVRRAVYKAIDPETIISAAYGSGWLTVGLPLPSVEWALPRD